MSRGSIVGEGFLSRHSQPLKRCTRQAAWRHYRSRPALRQHVSICEAGNVAGYDKCVPMHRRIHHFSLRAGEGGYEQFARSTRVERRACVQVKM